MTELKDHLPKESGDSNDATTDLTEVNSRINKNEEDISKIVTGIGSVHPGLLDVEVGTVTNGYFYVIGKDYVANDDTMYCYRSKDGKNWFRGTEKLPDINNSLPLFFGDAHNGTLIIPAGSYDLLISKDHGNTWTILPRGLGHPDYTNRSPYTVKTDKNGKWIVGYANGIIRISRDNCDTWETLDISNGQVPITSHTMKSLETDYKGRWFCSLNREVFMSTDNGETWTYRQDIRDLLNYNDCNFTTDGKGNWLIVGIRTAYNFLHSTDNGDTWEVVTNTIRGVDGSTINIATNNDYYGGFTNYNGLMVVCTKYGTYLFSDDYESHSTVNSYWSGELRNYSQSMACDKAGTWLIFAGNGFGISNDDLHTVSPLQRTPFGKSPAFVKYILHGQMDDVVNE